MKYKEYLPILIGVVVMMVLVFTTPDVDNAPVVPVEAPREHIRPTPIPKSPLESSPLKKPSVSNPIYNTLYDSSFKKWSSVYNDYPWQWNKAQAIAESNLNPNAVSPVGAMGISQFMPDTWEDMEERLNFSGSPFNASLNIQAQSYYMQTLRNQFKAERPEWDKHSLALASYNAGLGNILKAQSYEGSILYAPMIIHLPKVTGVSNSKQTRDYVERTWYYIRLQEVENGEE